jgi:hypothetical protein
MVCMGVSPFWLLLSLPGKDSSATFAAEDQSFDRTYQRFRSLSRLIITLPGR